MVFSIYKKAFKVCMKKPFKLWGISLLNILLSSLAYVLFGSILGVAIAIELSLSVSMSLIFLRGYRGEELKSADLFYNFADGKRFLRVVGGMGWRELWIFIFTIIPIVGPVFGIIRSYEYALCPYILSFEADVKATEATKVSKERTNGYKGHMFLADIIPVLAVWSVSLTLGLLSLIPFIGRFFAFINVITMIAVALILPLFLGLVHAAFYEEIMAARRAKEAAASAPVIGAADRTAAIESPANETPAAEAPAEKAETAEPAVPEAPSDEA